MLVINSYLSEIIYSIINSHPKLYDIMNTIKILNEFLLQGLMLFLFMVEKLFYQDIKSYILYKNYKYFHKN